MANENAFKCVVNFGTPAQTFTERGSAKRHDHEFLGVCRLPSSVFTTIQNVQHWDWEDMGMYTTNVSVEGKPYGIRGCFGNGQAGSKDSVSAQFGFVGGSVQVQ